jgi:hypothetical protein
MLSSWKKSIMCRHHKGSQWLLGMVFWKHAREFGTGEGASPGALLLKAVKCSRRVLGREATIKMCISTVLFRMWSVNESRKDRGGCRGQQGSPQSWAGLTLERVGWTSGRRKVISRRNVSLSSVAHGQSQKQEVWVFGTPEESWLWKPCYM